MSMLDRLAEAAYAMRDFCQWRARLWLRLGRWLERKAVDRRIPSRTDLPF